MKASLDISYYPLNDNYRSQIIEFIQKIKENYPLLTFDINGLSTQIFGDYDLILKIFQEEIKTSLEKGKCMFVMKIAPYERKRENLPKELQDA